MTYELQPLLAKCDLDDYRVLTETIATYVGPTDDRGLRDGLDGLEKDPSPERRAALTRLLEREIRYLGSSDAAYLWRLHVEHREPAGVSVDQMIRDVSGRLRVKQRLLGSTEARLEHLVKEVAEKTFFKLSSEAQRELFARAGLSTAQQREFFQRIKENKALFFPVLNAIVGPKVVFTLIEGIVISLLAQFVGREAAKELVKRLIARAPWIANVLGPVVWGASVGWLIYDVQGPAYRKTVPLLLYLGVVGLRDGAEPTG
jgi:uncharacterized protein YaaW (UPF0174 family)